MDLDAYASVHQPAWKRLDALARTRRLDAEQADELLELYGRVSTHLSVVQAHDPDGPQASGLSMILSRARSRITGAPSNASAGFSRFFLEQLPAAFYRIRWLTLIIGVAFCLVAVWFGWWVANEPQVLASLGTDEQRRQFVEEQFVGYYSENPAASFAGQVWTNNAWIAAQEVAFGITGYFVPLILFSNAQSVGISGGVMAAHGELDTFFLYILPHGLMELTAIFIAGAAGLRIFWAWVAPGQQTRLDSLATEGRALITVAGGLVLVLAVSGVVEGFVTPSDLPHWARLGIGALVLAGYWTYTLVLGGRAVRAGATGDLESHDAGARQLTA
ncbi:stage II sporulation protein M [Citricoccus sp. GCM10030269]|uniref:stage II sporulation protein M n=1 Tax=Citricoccus sp. GCM10030269 TaxID=3273388 RepID=UPI00360890F1